MIRVEQARCADAALVAPLFDAYRQFYGEDSDVPAATDFLTTRLACGDGIVLFARVDPASEADLSTVVGFAQLYRSLSSIALARTFLLNDLFVVPAWRRRGVARRLLDDAAALADSAGAVRLEIATRHNNRHALRLYESQGFVRDTEFTHLHLQLRPKLMQIADRTVRGTPTRHEANGHHDVYD